MTIERFINQAPAGRTTYGTSLGDFHSFRSSQRDIKAPVENPWVRIASSVPGFSHRSLIEAKHAGSGAHPGAIFIISGRLRSVLNRSQGNRQMTFRASLVEKF